ncbi:MAG TPA: hypothetical protein PKD17_02485 [Cellvibrionaceae bacterium]|nr:hypothetical protein [Cellvibrionaceae bacterium]HMW70657.1 hypothetical protein [Cellvibrionaceae bacterium]HNG58181.1 hypothetical protein [Cellvibrionaceae bacterium]
MRKFITAGISLIICVISAQANAHVKWFVSDEGAFANVRFSLDTISGLVVCGAIIFLLLASWAEFNGHSRTQQMLYSPWLKSNYIYALIKASVLILLLGNIIQGHFIAPNIPIAHHAQTEHVAQALLILLLVFDGVLFAVATLLLCAALILLYGLDIAIDYIFELAAIALAVGLCCPSKTLLALKQKISPAQCQLYALTALRFGLGVQLCVLTVHDKLMHPGLALQFLQEYPYFNFMRLSGLESFSDLHFVLSAGLAEMCFGLLLITNIAQRLASSCICFFFLLSGLVLGPAELLGHIPIFAAAIILLINPAPSLNLIKKPPLAIKDVRA